MLVSHEKKFIYLKTSITASTTIETYFETYCLPPQERGEISTMRDYNISEYSIVGARGKGGWKLKWWSHMPAVEIKNKLPKRVWNEYTKIACIRNPFDKVISYFYHLKALLGKSFSTLPLRRKIQKLAFEVQTLPANEVEQFSLWVSMEHYMYHMSGGAYTPLIRDKDKFMVDGDMCLDEVIRYENLKGDLKRVSKVLDVEFEKDKIRDINYGSRNRNVEVEEMYSEKCKQIVKRHYKATFEVFDYSEEI